MIIKIFTSAIFISILFFQCGKTTNTYEKKSQNKKVLEKIYSLENFNPNKNYDYLSLEYDKKPLLKLGQNVNSLNGKLSKSLYTGDYADNADLILDYYSTDIKLSVELKEGLINGILSFSANRKTGKIFNISGNWTLDADLENKQTNFEIKKAIVENLFPILKEKLELKPNWSYTNEKATYIEYFKVKQTGELGNHWNLDYIVKPK